MLTHAPVGTTPSAQQAPVHPAFVNDRAAAWLGVEVLRAEFGDVLIRMQLRDKMLNGYGMAQRHGVGLCRCGLRPGLQ